MEANWHISFCQLHVLIALECPILGRSILGGEVEQSELSFFLVLERQGGNGGWGEPSEPDRWNHIVVILMSFCGYQSVYQPSAVGMG